MQNFTEFIATFLCRSTLSQKVMLYLLPILLLILLHLIVTQPWLQEKENQLSQQMSMKKRMAQTYLEPKRNISEIQKKIVNFCTQHKIVIDELSMDPHMVQFVGSGEYVYLLGLVEELEKDGFYMTYLSQKIDENYTIELTFKIVF